MYHVRITLLALFALATTAASTAQPAQQSVNDLSAIELAASRAMLESDPLIATAAARPGPIVISPAFAVHGTAPGVTSQALRPAARGQTLARSLQARVAPFSEVRKRCLQCPLTGADLFLHLSNPLVTGASATVTITAVFNTGNIHLPTAYETVEFRLERRAGMWVVTGRKQLGIS